MVEVDLRTRSPPIRNIVAETQGPLTVTWASVTVYSSTPQVTEPSGACLVPTDQVIDICSFSRRRLLHLLEPAYRGVVEPEDGVGVGVVADGVGVLVVTSALGDDVASLGGSTSAMCRPVTPINGRCEDLGVIGDEARIVDAFCAWLEAQGWTTQREIEFVDIAASRVISVYMQRRRGARVPCGYIERRTGLLGPDLRGRLRPQPGPAIPNLIRELDALDPAAGVLDLGESWTHSSTALSRQP